MSHLIKKIGLSETIEVAVLNINSREYKFSDNESSLQNVVLEGFIIHTDALGVGKSGRVILPLAEIKKGLITLAAKTGKLVNKELPLETILNNDAAITYVKPFLIDVAKSLIILPNSTALVLPAGAVPGYTVVVTLFYRMFNAAKDRVDADGYVIE